MSDEKAGFAPPSSVEGGLRRKDELVAEIQKIDVQLSSRNKTDGQGRRVDSQEFWAWRQKAIYAKAKLTGELRQLKAWLREQFKASKETVTREFLDLLVKMAVEYGDDLTELQGFIEAIVEGERPDLAWVAPDLLQFRMAGTDSAAKKD